MGLLNHTFRIIRQMPYSRLGKYRQVPLLVILVFIFTIGTARSYVNDYGRISVLSENVSHETLKANIAIPSSVAGPCTFLLNKQTHTPSKSPVLRTQRSVGKVAALGLLLGVRFALEPKQNHSANVNEGAMLVHQIKAIDKPTYQSAKNVMVYRQCLKKQALRQIALAR